MSDPFAPALPSARRALLERLLGRRITDLVRYEWAPLDTLGPPEPLGLSIFRAAPGPLRLTLDDGTALAFASDAALASVVLWLEHDPSAGAAATSPLAEDPALYPIAATDPRYGDPCFAALLGAEIAAVELLERASDRPKLRALPREAALVLTLAGGRCFALGHGLRDDGDDFELLTEDELSAEVRRGLTTAWRMTSEI